MNQFQREVELWFEDELELLDPSPDEADILRKEFAGRERGFWTVRGYADHMRERIRQLRMGF